ncbi:putative ribosomal protein P0 [Trypoxylus dichotomus]
MSLHSISLIIEQVYDSGTICAPEILNIKPEDVKERFMIVVGKWAVVCLGTEYPMIASAPHSTVNGFKNLLAIDAATYVDFKEATTRQGSDSAAAATPTAAADVPVKEVKREESESMDNNTGVRLFD